MRFSCFSPNPWISPSGKWFTNPLEKVISEGPKAGSEGPCSNHRAQGGRHPWPRPLGCQVFLAQTHLGPPLRGSNTKASLPRVQNVTPGTLTSAPSPPQDGRSAPVIETPVREGVVRPPWNHTAPKSLPRTWQQTTARGHISLHKSYWDTATPAG